MAYIKDGFSNESKFDIRQWKDIKSGFTHFQNNDLGIAKITPCFENRKSVIFKNLYNTYGAGTTELHIFRPIVSPLIAEYALYISKTENFISNGIANFSGAVGQQRVGKDTIGDYLIALPPLEELSKILSSISKLFLIVNGIENDESQLSSYIQKTKSKILDLAIRGKLVPQDPNDEPASVLLERIKAEHPESKKKAKNTGDNSHYPFDIPESWEWCSLDQISQHISAGGDKPVNYSVSKTSKYSIPIYSNGKDKDGLYGYTDNATINKPSITISARGTIGFSCIRFEPFCPIVRLISITPNILIIDIIYLHYTLMSLIPQGEGSSIPQLTIPNIKPKEIPIPPILEQKRIVKKIEDIFASLDEIVNSIIA
jgi:type I restriction enzyme S subunit